MQNGPIVNPRWQTLKRSSPTRREVKQTKTREKNIKAWLPHLRENLLGLEVSHKEKKKKKEQNGRKFKSGLEIFFLYLSVGCPFLQDEGVEDFWATSGSCERQTGSWCWRVWDYKLRAYRNTDFFFGL